MGESLDSLAKSWSSAKAVVGENADIIETICHVHSQ